MISVMHNLSAMYAMRSNREATRSLQDSFRKLSSGLRVERAADDAAGLAVSENLDTRARSQRVAMRNTNDGISVVQTAEGGLNEVADMVKRMRELAVQASSETLAATERTYLNDEFSELQNEMGRIKQVTEFNGNKLLDGSLSTGMNVQVGADNSSDNRIAIELDDFTLTGSGLASKVGGKVGGTFGSSPSPYTLGPTGSATPFSGAPSVPDVLSAPGYEMNSATARATAINDNTGTHGVTATAGASSYTASNAIVGGHPVFLKKSFLDVTDGTNMAQIDFFGTTVLNDDSDGAVQDLLQTELTSAFGAGTYTVDTSSGTLNITAEDGRTFVVGSKNIDVQKAVKVGAKETGTGTLSLSSAVGFDYSFGPDWGLGVGTAVAAAGSDVTDQATANLNSVANARAAIGIMDSSLDVVNGQRSKLGAVENRLTSALNMLETDTESLFAAKSRISDLDFARESANMARAQIMQQASTAVMAQAQQLPQMVLRLI